MLGNKLAKAVPEVTIIIEGMFFILELPNAKKPKLLSSYEKMFFLFPTKIAEIIIGAALYPSEIKNLLLLNFKNYLKNKLKKK